MQMKAKVLFAGNNFWGRALAAMSWWGMWSQVRRGFGVKGFDGILRWLGFRVRVSSISPTMT